MTAYISYKDGSVGTLEDVFMITEREDLGTVTIHSQRSLPIRKDKKELYSIIVDFTEGGIVHGNDQRIESPDQTGDDEG